MLVPQYLAPGKNQTVEFVVMCAEKRKKKGEKQQILAGTCRPDFRLIQTLICHSKSIYMRLSTQTH